MKFKKSSFYTKIYDFWNTKSAANQGFSRHFEKSSVLMIFSYVLYIFISILIAETKSVICFAIFLQNTRKLIAINNYTEHSYWNAVPYLKSQLIMNRANTNRHCSLPNNYWQLMNQDCTDSLRTVTFCHI
jgi:hypothetical protein